MFRVTDVKSIELFSRLSTNQMASKKVLKQFENIVTILLSLTNIKAKQFVNKSLEKLITLWSNLLRIIFMIVQS